MNRRRFDARWLAPAAMAFFALACIAKLGETLNLHRNFSGRFIEVLSRIYVFDYTLVELTFAALAVYLLLRGPFASRVVGYVIFGVVAAVYAVQHQSLSFGSELLSQLAVDNLNHIRYFL